MAGVTVRPTRWAASLATCVGLLAGGLLAGAPSQAGTGPGPTSTAPGPGETTTTDVGATTTVDPGATSTTDPDGTTTTGRSPTTTTTVPTLTDLPDHETDPDFQLSDLVGEEYAGQPAFDPAANQVRLDEVRRAQESMIGAEARYRALVGERRRLERVQAALGEAVGALDGDTRTALARTAAARQQFEDRAVEAYIRGNQAEAAALFGSRDTGQLASRVVLMEIVLEADEDAIDRYVDARVALGDDLSALFDEVTTTDRSLARARLEVKSARRALAAAKVDFAVWSAGSQLDVDGFVFPVFGPVEFADTFGAPRMNGTRYQHWHEGTDVVADSGTPLLTVENSVVTRIGNHVLGGLGVTLRGASGPEYYYAHLSGLAPGVATGKKLRAGEVIGYVGATGNAQTAHLHFEIHAERASVNPYPLLRVTWDWQSPDLLPAAEKDGVAIERWRPPPDAGLRAEPPTLDGPGAISAGVATGTPPTPTTTGRPTTSRPQGSTTTEDTSPTTQSSSTTLPPSTEPPTSAPTSVPRRHPPRRFRQRPVGSAGRAHPV